jgi:hypothetical protein
MVHEGGRHLPAVTLRPVTNAFAPVAPCGDESDRLLAGPARAVATQPIATATTASPPSRASTSNQSGLAALAVNDRSHRLRVTPLPVRLLRRGWSGQRRMAAAHRQQGAGTGARPPLCGTRSRHVRPASRVLRTAPPATAPGTCRVAVSRACSTNSRLDISRVEPPAAAT